MSSHPISSHSPRIPRACLRTAAWAVALAAAPPVAAQEPSEWVYSLGVGVVGMPTYEGSKNHTAMPLPILGVSWRDTVSLNTLEGLKISVNPSSDRGVYFGGGVGYWLGRPDDADKDHGDALRGLGDVSGGAIGKLEIGYRVDALSIGVEAARDILSDRDGTTISPNVAYRIYRSETFNLTGKVSATWADDNYMTNIFGITPRQAANSKLRYAPYTAEADFKDVKASLSASYAFTPSISTFAAIEGARLLGSAADSPIVKDRGSENQFTATLGLAYRF